MLQDSGERLIAVVHEPRPEFALQFYGTLKMVN